MWEGLAMIGLSIGIIMGGHGFWKLKDLLSVRLDNRRRLQVWQRAAASCGLQVKEVSSPSARRLTLAARAGPVSVWIEGARGLEEVIQVVVAVPGLPGYSEVTIHREPRKPLPWAQEIEVGDAPFDGMFYIGGPARLVCALLDA